jgi:hypothetical protein
MADILICCLILAGVLIAALLLLLVVKWQQWAQLRQIRRDYQVSTQQGRKDDPELLELICRLELFKLQEHSPIVYHDTLQ